MEVKPGYKQTEIGVIPEDWEIVPLSSCCDVRDGTHESPKYHSNGIPLVTSKNIVDGKLDLKDVSFISELDADMIDARSKVDTGDLLLSMIGTVGNVTKVDVADRFCIKNVALIKPRQVTGDYLLHLLRSDYFSMTIQSKLAGGIQIFISLGMLRSLYISIMSDHEQNKISETLSDIDLLITTLEKLIEKKKLIKQGVMQELLTGKRRLPGFRREWETKRLGDVSVVIMGQSPDSKYYNTDSKGIPLIQGNADIQNGKSVSRIWTKSITKECQKGAILITVRAPVGSVGISSSRACLGRGVCAVQPYSVNERYLYWQLKFSEDKWNESQQGSTFTSVNSSQIKDFCILCPTSFDEQAAIADVIEDIEIEIDLHIKQLNKQILLKQATMQELLTGRIRLV